MRCFTKEIYFAPWTSHIPYLQQKIIATLCTRAQLSPHIDFHNETLKSAPKCNE